MIGIETMLDQVPTGLAALLVSAHGSVMRRIRKIAPPTWPCCSCNTLPALRSFDVTPQTLVCRAAHWSHLLVQRNARPACQYPLA